MATKDDHQPTEEHGERQRGSASAGGGHGLRGAAPPVSFLPGPSLRVPMLAPVPNSIAQQMVGIHAANPLAQHHQNPVYQQHESVYPIAIHANPLAQHYQNPMAIHVNPLAQHYQNSVVQLQQNVYPMANPLTQHHLPYAVQIQNVQQQQWMGMNQSLPYYRSALVNQMNQNAPVLQTQHSQYQDSSSIQQYQVSSSIQQYQASSSIQQYQASSSIQQYQASPSIQQDSSAASVVHAPSAPNRDLSSTSSRSSSAVQIMEVWSANAPTAYDQIEHFMKSAEPPLIIAMDSEFAVPDDCAVSDGEPPNPEAFYSQMCNMINGGDLVQIGFVLATQKQLLGIYQFNLYFSTSWRKPYHPGIHFLQNQAGIIFEEHEKQGIPCVDFTRWLTDSGLLYNSNILWLTFAGCTDFGFLTHYVTGQALGPDRLQFLRTFRELFPQSYDIRIFTKLGRCRSVVIHGGLSKVCEKLQVPGSSIAHNSGHDALCTLLCLQQMHRDDNMFLTRITRYCGALYGVSDIDKFDGATSSTHQ